MGMWSLTVFFSQILFNFSVIQKFYNCTWQTRMAIHPDFWVLLSTYECRRTEPCSVYNIPLFPPSSPTENGTVSHRAACQEKYQLNRYGTNRILGPNQDKILVLTSGAQMCHNPWLDCPSSFASQIPTLWNSIQIAHLPEAQLQDPMCSFHTLYLVPSQPRELAVIICCLSPPSIDWDQWLHGR